MNASFEEWNYYVLPIHHSDGDHRRPWLETAVINMTCAIIPSYRPVPTAPPPPLVGTDNETGITQSQRTFSVHQQESYFMARRRSAAVMKYVFLVQALNYNTT